ncbi:DUF488 domain-containing protein [Candidatus Parcubacteria bacterium]|nr:DUF488 domain-containing protein [Candidatus Parcubacteria bacterium]
MKGTILLKRIYEPYAKSDGFRILVDRLWPRGIGKDQAKLNLWSKEIGPSTELRKWFGHDPQKWVAFKKKYRQELADKGGPLQELRLLHRKHKRVTLLYGARDEKHNEAVVLAEILEK